MPRVPIEKNLHLWYMCMYFSKLHGKGFFIEFYEGEKFVCILNLNIYSKHNFSKHCPVKGIIKIGVLFMLLAA